ncbi:MAG TPA: cyclic nucleotide-binding domain-containing protein [Kofleriaceae bacterium]|nr:cyclic nucleotide-binding domain-containing protein [Kofleriaceae bacterium]
MAALGEVKGHATRLYAKGEPLHALRLYDSIVAAAPLDHDARMKVADCLVALGRSAEAAEIYRAVAWYCVRAGHPLAAMISARVLEQVIGAEADDVQAALVAHYGRESELIGRVGARINQPDPSTQVSPPELRVAAAGDPAAAAAQRAIHCLDGFEDYPESLHPIPLLSELSEASFRRVLRTLVVRRLPAGAWVIRQGEPGQSFFLVATGEVRVFTSDAAGRDSELARLHEGAIFGEMALISAQPRSASVQTVSETDLLEVTAAGLAELAGELDQVAAALHRFTRERMLRNLMATNRLFRPFDRTQQRDLLRRFTSHDVAPGTDIIRQGDPGAGLFVVLSGEVEVVHTGEDGARTPLATLHAHDVVGEMSLVRGGNATATVTALTMSTVLFLAREYVARIMAAVPDVRQYLEALSEDRHMDTQLALAGDEAEEDEIIFI